MGKHFISFKNHKNILKAPFIIYADCECILKTSARSAGQEYQSYTGTWIFCNWILFSQQLQCKHVLLPALVIAQLTMSILQNGLPKNCCKYSYKVHGVEIEKSNSNEESDCRASSWICHICKKPLYKKRVRDHSQLTDEYKGAAHEHCNLNYQDTRAVPLFNNLSGYDAIFSNEEAMNLKESINLKLMSLPFTCFVKDI